MIRIIRIDALRLAVDSIDMRAGSERLLARVVQVFGAAQSHHAYLFANARHTRVKLLVHDGFGVWCAARRLNQGRFVWPPVQAGTGRCHRRTLTQAQFDALILGLPWQHLEDLRTITRI
ncbi:IS66 family insertion sequence element accessory protein TnpB [Cupriavidus sp. UYPR2.512]|uniref:IS66 family insertion sequence element accessory protein TnpB n=1 Tax=Cupriavidus sp. UYPR2.512 TaxID=1080187 RepID=UPI0009DA01C7|nr:IS66 family insertion sequence element accessory protein TnpB [Cupriavidus sp. UYPR2.512]UIF88472.1 IS66 family insertion sequence element accessory protein TnpB [Cupriavidus necator]